MSLLQRVLKDLKEKSLKQPIIKSCNASAEMNLRPLEQVGSAGTDKPSACVALEASFGRWASKMLVHKDGSYQLTEKGNVGVICQNCIAGP
jgi:hypothetical protein